MQKPVMFGIKYCQHVIFIINKISVDNFRVVVEVISIYYRNIWFCMVLEDLEQCISHMEKIFTFTIRKSASIFFKYSSCVFHGNVIQV